MKVQRSVLLSINCVMALGLSTGLGTSMAFAEGETGLWPQGREVSFHRYGEPPRFDPAKVLGQPVAKTLASLQAPLQLLHTTSSFGWREKLSAKWQKFHYGIDYAAPVGTPIHVAQSGIVEVAGRRHGFGYCVKVRHDNGVETVYGHLTRFISGLRRGAVLKAGDVIGYVGSTGRSTGPHLHYEVMVDGIPVDPAGKFQQAMEFASR